MNELKFDPRGFLYPHQKINLTLNAFEDMFVKGFPQSVTRQRLFENYQIYVRDFRQLLTPVFSQWINGSFVTRKTNPRDIDIVTLIDFQTDLEHEKIIAERFVNRKAIEVYGVDAYTLTVFPEAHRQHVQTKSDLLYWNDWFGRSWSNRTGSRHPKGYVEIQFLEN
ncbi:MAG: hypothetical protein EPO28_03700 [Saprospiraceae bacterium]|nr:MAG: hypothetical protein EPO28_03700 [Saprospiraceae bacterium]